MKQISWTVEMLHYERWNTRQMKNWAQWETIFFNSIIDNSRETVSMKLILTEVAMTQAGQKSAFLILMNEFEIHLEKIQSNVS